MYVGGLPLNQPNYGDFTDLYYVLSYPLFFFRLPESKVLLRVHVFMISMLYGGFLMVLIGRIVVLMLYQNRKVNRNSRMIVMNRVLLKVLLYFPIIYFCCLDCTLFTQTTRDDCTGLSRSSESTMEIRTFMLCVEIDLYPNDCQTASRLFIGIGILRFMSFKITRRNCRK